MRNEWMNKWIESELDFTSSSDISYAMSLAQLVFWVLLSLSQREKAWSGKIISESYSSSKFL